MPDRGVYGDGRCGEQDLGEEGEQDHSLSPPQLAAQFPAVFSEPDGGFLFPDQRQHLVGILK